MVLLSVIGVESIAHSTVIEFLETPLFEIQEIYCLQFSFNNY